LQRSRTYGKLGVRETAALLAFTRYWLVKLSKPLKTTPTLSLYRIVDTSDVKRTECHKYGIAMVAWKAGK
jgi:hypothetical protein